MPLVRPASLTTTGALLIVADVACLFAWNSAGLHCMAKFALIEVGIVAAVPLAWC